MVRILRVNVLLVEYRGYGDSDDARPCETGFMRDARAALKCMLAREDIDPARIIAFGRSIGGAVALSLRRELGAGGGGQRRPSRVLSPFGAHRGMSRLSTKDDDEDDGSPPRNGPGWDESPRRSEVGDNYTL